MSSLASDGLPSSCCTAVQPLKSQCSLLYFSHLLPRPTCGRKNTCLDHRISTYFSWQSFFTKTAAAAIQEAEHRLEKKALLQPAAELTFEVARPALDAEAMFAIGFLERGKKAPIFLGHGKIWKNDEKWWLMPTANRFDLIFDIAQGYGGFDWKVKENIAFSTVAVGQELAAALEKAWFTKKSTLGLHHQGMIPDIWIINGLLAQQKHMPSSKPTPIENR